jgi:hypothetical protein
MLLTYCDSKTKSEHSLGKFKEYEWHWSCRLLSSQMWRNSVWWRGTNVFRKPATSTTYPVERGSSFPQNTTTFLPDLTATYPRRWHRP